MPDRDSDDAASSRALWVTLVLGLATFAVGAYGLYRALPDPSPLDVAYRTLQLFVLDGGALDPPADSPGPLLLNPWLQIARFAAPVVTVTAIVLALPNLVRRSVLRRWATLTPGHVIVCGDTAEAIALARNVHRNRRMFRMPVVLVVSEPDRAPHDVPVVVGRSGSEAMLRAAGIKRASAVYAMAASSASSTAIALSSVKHRERRGGAPLRAYARVRGEDLIAGLRLRRTAAVRPGGLDFFTIADVAVDRLLNDGPPDPGTPEVVGSGELYRALRRALERRAAGIAADAAGAGTVYVCGDPDGGDEDDMVATALHLAATRAPQKIVLCVQRRSPFAEVVADDGPITVFGILDEVCTPDAIADGAIVNRMARAIHDQYVNAAARRQETPETNPSTVRWDELSRHLKDSNIGQAEHIGAKLVDIGVTLTPVRPQREFAFTDAELLQLAQSEHVRWVKERTDAGFRYGPRRTGMEHPDLVDWSNLSDAARDKDVDAIRNLPVLLAGEGVYLRRDCDQ